MDDCLIRMESVMSFQLTCPNCGRRDVYEFRYGGQILNSTPPVGANLPGPQFERWYHRFGCRRWLIAERDSRTNTVIRTAWLEEGAS